MNIIRKHTRALRAGSLQIGGNAPIVVQSMTNTDTRDAEATLAQIQRLAAAGCELVRVAVPDDQAASKLRTIADRSPIPVLADIHFDYRLALKAIESGLVGIRINPGNIGPHVDTVVDAAKAAGCFIRIGVNSGSVEKSLLEKFGGPTPEAMVESALRHVRMLEKRNFHDMKISIKSSSVPNTIDAYRILSQACDYPLHLGVTEAGGPVRGAVKSAAGLGILLAEGIGDTIRVSLTADPEEEMTVAWELLRCLGLRSRGPELISCPTCGRTEIQLIQMAEAVEQRLRFETAPIKVAVMGCVVNGPGEAKGADIGLAGGRDKGVIFRKGEVIRTVRGCDALLAAFMEELDILCRERTEAEKQSRS
ncbi:MAG: flavodoxin-dependent (E)-4-hydroxy-3-methylbut-2-enyl-diphosphate synthase [Desulfovibrionaceae bacterium]|nr:flavodoxin-dependent (E)-4-hydroxy-3-methylbut-2-enyl-diphosphate synthase [Desulfovibrionaceae bacterium]